MYCTGKRRNIFQFLYVAKGTKLWIISLPLEHYQIEFLRVQLLQNLKIVDKISETVSGSKR